jgi:hypothetical protein
MTRITVDSELQAQLSALTGHVELCDATGESFGVFLSTADWERLMYAWAQAEFTDEEIERSEQEGGEHTLADILASLPRK